MILVLIWVLGGLAFLLLLDRVLLRLEARGWINYRRRGLSRGGAAFHALTLQSIFNPSARHLQTVAYEQIEERDDSGDPAPTDPRTEDPMTPAEHAVRRYLEHANAHDVSGALACLDDAFELEFAGSGHVLPKGAVAAALGWDAGVQGRMDWEVVAADGPHVTITGQESNAFLTLLGIERLPFRSMFEVTENGSIRRQMHEVDWGNVSLDAVMQPLVDWARSHAPDELAEIYPEGRMQYTREAGARWVALAQRWRQAG